MTTTTLDDISLKKITLDTLPRLKVLREAHFQSKPEVCIELAKLLTQHKCLSTETSDSAQLRAGKRLEYVLKNKNPIIGPSDLLAGTTTSKSKGVIIYPQFLGYMLWPELSTLPRRKKDPYQIADQDVNTLDLDIFPKWMNDTIIELCRKDFGTPLSLQMAERLFFFLVTKAHVISHTIPAYELVISRGLEALIHEAQNHIDQMGISKEDLVKKDFYQSMVHSLKGVVAFSKRLSQSAQNQAARTSDAKREQELLTLSRVCERVPRKPPQTFYEGLQAVWICHLALHQENNNIAISLGRLDQLLYPLFQSDVQNKRLTVEQAVELVGCFFLRLVDHVPMMPQFSQGLFSGSGSNQALTLGGINLDGQDAVNDLTYVMLRAAELLMIRDPNVNARVYPGVNEQRYLKRLCEFTINTGVSPCFQNDRQVIKTLTRSQNCSEIEARDYAIVGCVEPVLSGKTFGHSGAIMLNLTAGMEMAFYQGKHRIDKAKQFGPKTPSIEELQIGGFDFFFSAVTQQIIFLIDQSTQLNDLFGNTHKKNYPLPLLSCLTRGPMEKGRDLLSGGAQYNTSGIAVVGLAEVVDSLCAIAHLVYHQKTVTLHEMVRAIENDWQGFEKLRQIALHLPHKFGTDSQLAKRLTDQLMHLLHGQCEARTNYKGGKYTVGYWSMTTHACWGSLLGALPSGRKKGEPLPSGITPVSGMAPEITEMLRFVATLDTEKITNGQALNLRYLPQPDAKKMAADFAGIVLGFMSLGGLQVQCNLIDENLLEEAKENPGKYPNLLVRVSGYTAYFADLNPDMQDEIIHRTRYSFKGSVAN